MNEVIILLLFSIILVIVTVGTAKYFYLLNIKKSTERYFKRNNLNLKDLHYSFEQIVFFYKLPSNIRTIKQAKREHLSLKLDFSYSLFVELKGIYIEVEGNESSIILAYLPIKNFMLPYLDEKLQEGLIDESMCNKISIAKLLHKNTLVEIMDEVYNQIQFGRYN